MEPTSENVQAQFSPEIHRLIDSVLHLFRAMCQLPISMYEVDSNGSVLSVASLDEQLTVPETIDDSSAIFDHVSFPAPVVQSEETYYVIHYGEVSESETEKVDELSLIRKILPRILKVVTHEYAFQRDRDMEIRRAAYHDIQIRLQAALAHAENLIEVSKKGKHLVESVESLMGAVSAAATVMHNLSYGSFLPENYIFRYCDIPDLIRRIAGFFRAEAAAKNIRIEVDVRPHQLSVQASELHLENAISNLLQNAVKYSYRARASDLKHRFISVQGRIVGGDCEISISNYGVGIESDEYRQIFLDGYKGRLTRREYRTGSGQGLALTKKIVEGHGGVIEVHSRPMGDKTADGNFPYLTRFIVRLPIKQSKA